MTRAMEREVVVWIARRRGPPRWAVAVVKCCVVGLLLLPVATLLWAMLYRPSGPADADPVAFLVALGIGLVSCVSIAVLIHVFPPVRARGKQ